MHRLSFVWVDVFSATPLAVNGLTVFTDASGLSDATLAALAGGALHLGSCPTQAGPDLVGVDLDGGALVAFTGGVLALLEATGDEHAHPLGERCCRVLAHLAPGHDVEVRGLFLPFTVLLVATADGETERCDATTAGREAQFGIAGEISHEGDCVVGHVWLLLFCPVTASVCSIEDGSRRRCHAATSGLIIRKTEQLVAQDVVGDAETALDLVQGASGSHDVEHRVVTVVLLLDGVRQATLAPPVGVAVYRTAHLGDGVGDGLDVAVGCVLIELTADDDHEFIGTHCV